MIDFIKKRRLLALGIVGVLLLVGAGIALSGNGHVETASVSEGDLVRTVKIAGKVIPRNSANLGFEISGTVRSIVRDVGATVRAGDTIIRLDASGISADISKADAELALAIAGLNKLKGANVFESQITSSKQAIVQTIKDTYAAAEDAVYNKTDQFFIDPDVSRPEMKANFVGYNDLKSSITTGRVSMNIVLESWSKLIANLTTSTYNESHLSGSKTYLASVNKYIADAARATTLFEVSSAVSQADIDNYRADAVAARDSLNASSQNLISAEEELKSLMLDVPAQVARVEAARATLSNLRSQLRKTTLVSPIAGVVSKQDAEVGQVVSASTNIVSVISPELEIEAFIPEVLIAGLVVGNTASITLDAYPSDTVFLATVAHVDPAETIRDGVSTYKTRLIFTNPDSRPRSGMSANVVIETYRKNSVLLIPERAVVREGDESFVYIYDGKSEVRTPVTIGERDSSGNVELLTELTAETQVVINPKAD